MFCRGRIGSKLLCSSILISAFCLIAISRGAIRIVDYNVCGDIRTGMDVVMTAIGNENRNGIVRPVDILMLEEQTTLSGTTQAMVNLLNGIYGAGTYDRGTVTGYTTGSGTPCVVYNKNVVTLLEEKIVNTTSSSGPARSTMRYKFQLNGYDSPDAVFYTYVSHYKASDTTADAARRNVEAQLERADADALGSGVHIIYAGDLNLYAVSREPAWSTLTAAGNGKAYDPANAAGDWHDNAAFKLVHTQSPVTTARYGGQVTGGLDDRFDFQLVSAAFMDNQGLSYIAGSDRTFGNNGTHTMNGEIGSGTGASTTVLNALMAVSDHLPVVADYQIPAKMQVTVDPVPASVAPGTSLSAKVTVKNVATANVAADADSLAYSLVASGSGNGSASGTVPAAQSTGAVSWITLDTSTPGSKTAYVDVTSSSQAVDNGVFHQAVTYNVDNYLTGDFNHSGALDVNDIDLMYLALGGSDMTYDLNSDDVVDSNDLTFMVQNLFATSFGDVNLDKTVDYVDLEIMLGNWMNTERKWERGDMNGDGIVDFVDLALLEGNLPLN
jgi:hypothetical protein